MNTTPLNDTIGSTFQSLPIVACPTAPGGWTPGHSTTPNLAATTLACDGLLAVKLWTALGALVTPFAASAAVALQKRVPVDGKLDGGTNPVSLTPSETVPVTRIEANVDTVLISNL